MKRAAGPRRLLPRFLEAARRHGVRVEEPVTAAQLFRLVRDMPYRRPSDGCPQTLVAEWCGTCSGKHVLLGRLLGEIGVPSRLMIATYRYSWQGASGPPAELAAVLAAGPVPDVHNFLEIASEGDWLPVDATWSEAAGALGFSFNRELLPGVAHDVACTPPYRAWPVPAGADLAAYKRRIVHRHCGQNLPRREAFIAALAACVAAHVVQA